MDKTDVTNHLLMLGGVPDGDTNDEHCDYDIIGRGGNATLWVYVCNEYCEVMVMEEGASVGKRTEETSQYFTFDQLPEMVEHIQMCKEEINGQN